MCSYCVKPLEEEKTDQEFGLKHRCCLKIINRKSKAKHEFLIRPSSQLIMMINLERNKQQNCGLKQKELKLDPNLI